MYKWTKLTSICHPVEQMSTTFLVIETEKKSYTQIPSKCKVYLDRYVRHSRTQETYSVNPIWVKGLFKSKTPSLKI